MDWEKIKFGLLSAVGGAIVLAVIGFNWGGWVTTGSAEAMARRSLRMLSPSAWDRFALHSLTGTRREATSSKK